VRIANVGGRAAVLASDTSAIDVAKASDNRFGPALADVYSKWPQFTQWAAGLDLTTADLVVTRADLGAPSPEPKQVIAIGLNYRDHASESGLALPEGMPPVFTKFVSCITGPDTTVAIPHDGHNDWEAELVAVIGREARDVDAESAWDYVAGLTAGQDLSERISQLAGPAPQFSFGKSLPGFGPTGPWLVTVDEFANPDDLELGCAIDGETVQQARTSDLLFPVPTLVSLLSRGMTLLPGDIIFTGTPSGVGLGRDPQRWLKPRETLTTWIEGIGTLTQKLV
jgi:2,4-didehydro-3-deoxy-L-rhamnonate hydrolase